MTGFGLKWDIVTGRFEEQMQLLEAPIAEAATTAMRGVANIVKIDGASDIARAGFSTRWQKALSTRVYPEGRNSMRAAVFVRHRIPYAGVFEDGATIAGNPIMWIPLPGVPKAIGSGRGRRRLTPEMVSTSVTDLVSYRSRTGTPLLGARVRVTGERATAKQPKISLGLLRRQDNPGGRGTLRTVPLFFGVSTVNIKKKFNIRQVCERARNRIPSLYVAAFKG
jgi:hypothetical protein